jgi:hypothetical protein
MTKPEAVIFDCDGTCTCFSTDPVTWTHTEGYDPASYFDPDPCCPIHGQWHEREEAVRDGG